MKKKFRGEHSSNTSSILRTITSATPSISIGRAVVSDGYYIKLANSTNLLGVQTHTGIATSAGTAGSEISIIHHGLVDPTIFNLGDGYVCAVGTDNSGNVVRVTDGYCTSGLKYVGYCDGYGTITVAPRVALNINALDFGCVGDDATDNVETISAMFAFAKANSPINNKFAGLRIHFPKGIYRTSGQWNWDASADDITHDYPNTTITGESSTLVNNYNRGASTIIYTGTTSPFISARSSPNLTFENLSLLYNSSSFDGYLIDTTENPDLMAETTYFSVKNCILQCDGGTYNTAAAIILLGNAIATTIRDCNIGGAKYGINISPPGFGSAVLTTIKNCQFQGCNIAGVANPAFQCNITGCTFEDIPSAVLVDWIIQPYGTGIYGFCFSNNWVGDNENDGYACIDFGYSYVSGASIYGNLFGKNNCIRLGSAMSGCTIFGNTITTVDFTLLSGGSYATGVTIFGNQLNGANVDPWPYFKNFNNNNIGCSIFGNSPSFDTQGISGHIITWPTLLTQPTIVPNDGYVDGYVLEGTSFQGSNDTTGRITLTVAGGATSIGAQCTITFANTFDVVAGYNPHIFLTPENGTTAFIHPNIYVTPSGGTSFTINSINGITPGTYVWSYLVIQ